MRQKRGKPAPLPAESPWRILLRQPEAVVLSSRRIHLIARLLSLALVLGQLGAEAHAYSHLSDASKGLPDTAQSCRACLSFAPLHSAVGGSLSEFVVDQCSADTFVPLDEILIPHSPSRRAFQSRAPPALL